MLLTIHTTTITERSNCCRLKFQRTATPITNAGDLSIVLWACTHPDAHSDEEETLVALEECMPEVLLSLSLASSLKQFLNLALKCSAAGSNNQ